MPKTILFIHGRSFKPPKQELQKLWLDAVRFGMERDHPEKASDLADAKMELVYYGDRSRRFLEKTLKEPYRDDTKDRQLALAQLKQYSRSQFNKASYRELPGYNPWRESLASLFSSPLNYLGLTESLIEKAAPDIGQYWRCLLYTSPSPRDLSTSRMPSSA